MMNQSAEEALARSFIGAFVACDLDAMARHLSPAMRSEITNADGGVDRVDGRDAFMARIAAMNVAAVRPSITITQVLRVPPGDVLVMLEIEAARDTRTLHNFAALLLTIRDGVIDTYRMVEAKPAESAAFWSDPP